MTGPAVAIVLDDVEKRELTARGATVAGRPSAYRAGGWQRPYEQGDRV